MNDAYGNGLGRLHKEDWNDLRYMAGPVLEPMRSTRRSYRYWFQNGWWGDQNGYPQCVAYAFVHILEDGPVTRKGTSPVVDPAWLYGKCKQRDGAPNEDGTYGRVAAQILKEMGLISAYRWGMNMEDIRVAALEHSPIAMGTNWYRGMSDPLNGVMRLTGPIEGGHEWVINGYNSKRALYRIKNSWGKGWSKGGNAWIQEEDLERLLMREAGDACIVTEI